MDQTDKNTFTGRVIREYECRKCGNTDWEDDGIALWQALEDLQEKHDAKATAQATENPAGHQPEALQPARKPPASLWQRFTGLFRRKK
jgi:hypothetical protein